MKRTLIITAIFGLSALILSFAITWRETTSRERTSFNYEATQIVTLLTEHLNAAYHLAENFQSFFHASDLIDVDEFRIFAEDALSNCPSVKTAAYCPRIKLQNLTKFIEDKRYWGNIDFDVYKLDSNNKILKGTAFTITLPISKQGSYVTASSNNTNLDSKEYNI